MTTTATPSTLSQLAAASMSEDALISHLAHKLSPYGTTTREQVMASFHDTIYKTVRQLVPRGHYKRVVEAVAEEMGRQSEVRDERRRRRFESDDVYTPIGRFAELTREHKYRRMALLVGRIRGEGLTECSDFVRTADHLHIFYSHSGYTRSPLLVTRHSDGSWTEVTIELPKYTGFSQEMKLNEFLTSLAGYRVPRAALLRGASVAFDLCRAVFVATHPDGRVEEYPFGESPVEVCS